LTPSGKLSMANSQILAKNGLRAVKKQKRSRRWSVIGRDRGGGARFNGTRVGGRAGQGAVMIRRILAYRHGDGGWPPKIAS
jgi:hypothetical protein